MCGIAGIRDSSLVGAADALRTTAQAMGDVLAHRGPDGDAVWIDAEAGTALAHRRLAIIDLSPTGAQPMTSACGRYVITYNGEVFNFAELRADLDAAGHRFRGTSDTEVILEGFARWGLEPTIRRMVGMFAFAVWDRQTRRLSLVRDRLGIKPIYYMQDGNRFLFGSELKALRAAGGWAPDIDTNAVAGLMRYGYVPSPLSIYRGVAKVPPGTILTLEPGGAVSLSRYWDIRRVAIDGLAARAHATLSDRDAEDQLDALLRDAVRLRLISDVPLGAFLSGGVDSSTVTALMQVQSNRSVKTFSIGFRDKTYDESRYADAVARHLGTDHTSFVVEPEHLIDVIPRIPDWYDEPFADSSQIPTFIISRLTRRHATVALSGDGGDEVFAGYNRYFWAPRIWNGISVMPKRLRRAASALIGSVPPRVWDGAAAALPDGLRFSQTSDKARKIAALLDANDLAGAYRVLVSQWDDPSQIVPAGREPNTPLSDATIARDVADPAERMQLLDFMTYLPDDILTKVDRATMAVGLEGRVPLLDHRVVEFSWRLPLAMKVRNGQGKWLLKRVLARYVPEALTSRPKMGFGIPIGTWLRGPLRDWAEDLLSAAALEEGGIFHADPIRQLWQAHLSGAVAAHYRLWPILMFQAWRRRWLSGPWRASEAPI